MFVGFLSLDDVGVLVHGDRMLYALTVKLGRIGYFDDWDCTKKWLGFLHVFCSPSKVIMGF